MRNNVALFGRRSPSINITTNVNRNYIQSEDLLVNPGKGWIVYHSTANTNATVKAASSIYYQRYNWSDIHTGDDTFNWTTLDANIATAASLGFKFAFRVTPVSYNSPASYYGMPEWVVTAGSTYYTPAAQPLCKVPVWSDAVFIAKMNQFVTALAARYDGNEDIAYIDNGYYGNWGEWNLSGTGGTKPSQSILRSFVDSYGTAFTETQIIMLNSGGEEYGADQEFSFVYARDTYNHGWREDTAEFSGRWDSQDMDVYGGNPDNPIIAEMSGSYTDTKTDGGYHGEIWSDDMLIESIKQSKYNYYSLGTWNGTDANTFMADKPALITEWGNKMGYWFKIIESRYNSNLGNGATSGLYLNIRNDGYAKFSIKGKTPVVKIALLDASNNVLKIKTLSDINVRNWLAQTNTIINTSFIFPYNSSGVKIALGLFSDGVVANPDVKFGTDNAVTNNWQVLNTTITVDIVAPTWSGNNLSYADLQNTSLTLNWTAATDNIRVVGYDIYQNDILIASVGNVLTYDIIGLNMLTEYKYKLKAKDEANNQSAFSNEITVTTADLGAELVSNGTFNDSTGWSLIGSEWTITGGKLNCAATGLYNSAIYNISTIQNKLVEIRFDYTNTAGSRGGSMYAGGVLVENFGSSGIPYGTRVVRMTPGATTNISFNSGNNGTQYNIDNISIKEVL